MARDNSVDNSQTEVITGVGRRHRNDTTHIACAEITRNFSLSDINWRDGVKCNSACEKPTSFSLDFFTIRLMEISFNRFIISFL